MVSALLMLRRVAAAFRHAMREEDFGPVLSAGITEVLLGTITYTLNQDWNVVDSFYFTAATLTTTSVSDPDLVLQDGWIKLFTVFLQLVGIGVLVEALRRLGYAFVAVRAAERERPAQS